MRDAVASFVEDRDERYSPVRRPPPAHWNGFESKLQQQIRGRQPQPVRKARPRSWAPTLRWAAGIAASIGLVTILLVHPEEAVSAGEAIDRGARAEWSAGGVRRPLIYRKFRVDSAAGTGECEIWSAPQEQRVQDHWSGRPAIRAGLQAVYRKNRLNPETSLSPSGYRQWRKASLPAKDEVTVDRSRGLVTVSTTRLGDVEDGGIVQATLVMKQGDWHAIGEGFRVRDGHGYIEYWLREIDYRATVYTEEAWAQATGSGITVPANVPPKAAAPAAAEAPQSQIDESASELRVLEALSRQDLDTAADFEIRAGHGTVQVLAYGSPPDERARITSALGGIPGVRVQFPKASRGAGLAEQAYRESSSTVPPLMLKQLVLAVGSEQAAAERIAQVNAAFADARAQALALNRLSRRNTQLANAWIDRTDLRPMAEGLARRHAGKLAKRIQEVRELLRPILNGPRLQPLEGACRLWSGELSSLRNVGLGLSP
jgi:hypothetical protein